MNEVKTATQILLLVFDKKKCIKTDAFFGNLQFTKNMHVKKRFLLQCSCSFGFNQMLKQFDQAVPQHGHNRKDGSYGTRINQLEAPEGVFICSNGHVYIAGILKKRVVE